MRDTNDRREIDASRAGLAAIEVLCAATARTVSRLSGRLEAPSTPR